MAHPGHVLPDGIEPELDETLFYDPTGMGAPSGVHMAYVEVDPETGMIEILDYVAVDELAAVAKQDPVAHRRALLDKTPRAKAVLGLAAQKAGWS